MNPLQRYGTVQVETASRERLMLLLFETALKHMRAAGLLLGEGQRAEGVRLCLKASDIVLELHRTLDTRVAPELCDNLGALYRFVCARLLASSSSGDPVGVREAERTFAPLVEAFTGAVEQLRSAG